MGSAASREAKQPGPRDDAASTSSSSSCPVPEEFRHAAVYNVYNQRIDGSSAAEGSTAADLLDPTNNMPLQPNQQPCPGQRKLLSTERLQSNIPKGGTSSTWLYPSPQMFYNGAAATGAAAAGSACRLPPPVQRACAPRKCPPLPRPAACAQR